VTAVHDTRRQGGLDESRHGLIVWALPGDQVQGQEFAASIEAVHLHLITGYGAVNGMTDSKCLPRRLEPCLCSGPDTLLHAPSLLHVMSALP
jgi:hypothetical protein